MNAQENWRLSSVLSAVVLQWPLPRKKIDVNIAQPFLLCDYNAGHTGCCQRATLVRQVLAAMPT